MRGIVFGFLESAQLAGLVMTEHELTVPLDHARPDGEQITVFAREVAEPEGRDEAVPGLLPGRAGLRGAPARPATRAGRAGWTARCRTSACCCSTSAGPGARRRSTRPRDAPELPRALPRRLDRARRRAAARGARRRALERARAELRRAVRVHVPLARAGGAARGVRDRRRAADRPPIDEVYRAT